MRYLTVIYGFIFFLSVYGMMLLRRRGKWNLVFILFIITGLSVGLVNSAYVLGIDSNTRFGVRDLASFVEEDVDDNKRIAGGNLGGYLVTYTSKDVVSFPYHIEIGNEVVTIQEYYNIVTDPHNELHERYILLARGGRIKDYYYFDTNWVEENNISYIVWSIYDEFLIAPKEDYYNIIYAGIELPIKRPYISMRPPPDYEFSSDIYIHLETSGKYKKVKEFHKEGQKIIVIYRFDGQ